ncbi:hypothetical protein CYMTET_44121 [Cymbomonas tetramitiformis]|uniref:Uncharacterized protein n=1 Tax=Cymbomonas tetramitiformis TaxID=36881 RepID=A0AAE0EZW8_9CHLO|nr:hypothetical protein CYMTET_44121 [Cymbomonas tetramitiformis]
MGVTDSFRIRFGGPSGKKLQENEGSCRKIVTADEGGKPSSQPTFRIRAQTQWKTVRFKYKVVKTGLRGIGDTIKAGFTWFTKQARASVLQKNSDSEYASIFKQLTSKKTVPKPKAASEFRAMKDAKREARLKEHNERKEQAQARLEALSLADRRLLTQVELGATKTQDRWDTLTSEWREASEDCSRVAKEEEDYATGLARMQAGDLEDMQTDKGNRKAAELKVQGLQMLRQRSKRMQDKLQAKRQAIQDFGYSTRMKSIQELHDRYLKSRIQQGLTRNLPFNAFLEIYQRIAQQVLFRRAPVSFDRGAGLVADPDSPDDDIHMFQLQLNDEYDIEADDDESDSLKDKEASAVEGQDPENKAHKGKRKASVKKGVQLPLNGSLDA